MFRKKLSAIAAVALAASLLSAPVLAVQVQADTTEVTAESGTEGTDTTEAAAENGTEEADTTDAEAESETETSSSILTRADLKKKTYRKLYKLKSGRTYKEVELVYPQAQGESAATGKRATAQEILGLSKKEVNEKARDLFLKKYKKFKGTEKDVFYSTYTAAKLKKDLGKEDFAGNSWYYLKKGKIVFYVYPYELGPYACGFIEVSMPY